MENVQDKYIKDHESTTFVKAFCGFKEAHHLSERLISDVASLTQVHKSMLILNYC